MSSLLSINKSKSQLFTKHFLLISMCFWPVLVSKLLIPSTFNEHSTPSSYNSTGNVWTLRKMNTSLELDFNEALALQLNFTNFGEKCEKVGERNIIWLRISATAANLQFKPHIRGLFVCIL